MSRTAGKTKNKSGHTAALFIVFFTEQKPNRNLCKTQSETKKASVIGWAFLPTTTPIGVDCLLFFKNILPCGQMVGRNAHPITIAFVLCLK